MESLNRKLRVQLIWEMKGDEEGRGEKPMGDEEVRDMKRQGGKTHGR